LVCDWVVVVVVPLVELVVVAALAIAAPPLASAPVRAGVVSRGLSLPMVVHLLRCVGSTGPRMLAECLSSVGPDEDVGKSRERRNGLLPTLCSVTGSRRPWHGPAFAERRASARRRGLLSLARRLLDAPHGPKRRAALRGERTSHASERPPALRRPPQGQLGPIPGTATRREAKLPINYTSDDRERGTLLCDSPRRSARAYSSRMRLEGIRTGDIVEVDRLGRRFHALVTGNIADGLAVQSLERRVTYRSCRAHEVVGHWARRGRPRATNEPLEPSVLQLELDTTIRE
jgi:hypothetical protein